jgi:hypothetical protein
VTGPLSAEPAPGVWRIRIRCAPGKGATLFVVDADLAAGTWPECADVVLAGGHGSPCAASAAARRVAGEYPGAVAALAWHRETAAVFAWRDRGRASRSLFPGSEFGCAWIPEPGVQEPSFRAVLTRLIEVVVTGLEVGQHGEDLGGVVRRVELPDHTQRID